MAFCIWEEKKNEHLLLSKIQEDFQIIQRPKRVGFSGLAAEMQLVLKCQITEPYAVIVHHSEAVM